MDPITLFVALLLILVWVAGRSLLPKLLKRGVLDKILPRNSEEKKQALVIRIGLVTSLLVVWGLIVTIVAGGISHENNRYLLLTLVFGIVVIWITTIAVLRKK